MSDKLNRRGLLKKAALVTGGAVLAASHEENALMAGFRFIETHGPCVGGGFSSRQTRQHAGQPPDLRWKPDQRFCA